MVIQVKIPENTNAFTKAKLQAQLEALATLDQDTITKLVKLRKSKKAVEMLKENWATIEMMMM